MVVSRVRYVYACIHALSMIHVYICLYLLYVMLIVDPCFIVVYLLLRKTGTSVIVQVRSDAG